MARKASGLSLKTADIPTVLGMVARDDRDHDVAAWFGVNQGRIAEAKDGKYGTPDAAPAHSLPPKGPPGVKGRHLRASVQDALNKLKAEGYAGPALASLERAAQAYDTNEI